MLSDYFQFSGTSTRRKRHEICSPLYWTLRISKCFKHPSRMCKAGWRSDYAMQPSGSFHLIANPSFQTNSTENRKAQLCCITMVSLSHFSLQNCSLRLSFFIKALDKFINTLLHLQPPSCQLKGHTTGWFSFSQIPENTLLSDYLSHCWPWSEQTWTFSFTPVTLGQDCD